METRKQSGHVAKAMAEQTRAVKEMTAAARNVSLQIMAITRANREHSNTLRPAIVTSLSGQIESHESSVFRPEAMTSAAA